MLASPPEGEGSLSSPAAAVPEGEGSVIDVAVGTFTIECPIAGGALVKSGAGTLVSCGTDSYTCCTTVNDGMLQFQNGATLPTETALAVDGGIVDLGGATAALTTVTLAGGSIVNGTLDADTAFNLYSGAVLANMGGTAALDKFGRYTVVLAGQNTYSGGTNALGGTLVAAYQDSLPGRVAGVGTVIIQPTLYGSGNGDWMTMQWTLVDGTPTSWINGASVVIATGSTIDLGTTVQVSAITVQGDATISGGTLVLPLLGSMIDVLSGTALVSSTIAGGSFTESGPGTLVLDGPVAAPPLVAGGQVIGPGAVFASNGESLYQIDPAVFGLVQSLFVNDRGIDRADMIEVLDSAVVNGGVTPSALEALQALTGPQSESDLNIPDYVFVLASDVVNHNPANAQYQGRPLGDMADQATDAARAMALEDLVGKWFLGTDPPAIPIAAGLSYSVVAGSFFGTAQTPSSADMAQGCLGDCYLISALGAIADSSPAAIENMIINNGVTNGIHTYTIRFYFEDASGNFVPDYVTVNALLPGYDGYPIFASPGADGSFWMPLIEKAYAEWDETGREGRGNVNSYKDLNGGWMQDVDSQVLGCAATTYWPAGDPTAEQAVIAALQSHEAVTAGIWLSGDATRFNQLGLVSDHAYVVGYNSDPASPTYGMFQLENPWGFYEPAPLTWSDLCAYSELVVADTSGTVPAGDATMGQSALCVNSTLTVNPGSGLIGPGYTSKHIGSGAASWVGVTWPAVASDIANGGQLVFASSPTTACDNQISGTGSPVSASWGDGNVALADAGTFTSGTTPPVGTPPIGDGGTTGSVSGDAVDKAILRFLESDDATLNGRLAAAALSVEPWRAR